MPIKHSLLTGAALHEPKGVESAGASTYYRANGAGSGAWVKPTTFVTGVSASADETAIFVTPFARPVRLTEVTLMLGGAIEAAGTSVTMVVRNSAGGVIATFVIPKEDSAAGVSYTQALNHSVAAGSFVSVAALSPTATNSVSVHCSFAVELT